MIVRRYDKNERPYYIDKDTGKRKSERGWKISKGLRAYFREQREALKEKDEEEELELESEGIDYAEGEGEELPEREESIYGEDYEELPEQIFVGFQDQYLGGAEEWSGKIIYNGQEYNDTRSFWKAYLTDRGNADGNQGGAFVSDIFHTRIDVMNDIMYIDFVEQKSATP